VKPDEINAGLATSAQDLLVGKTPGVVVTLNGGKPEGGADIRIRGGSSHNATNDPLIVIDGVPVDNSGVTGMSNSLSMISPDNIESFTYLERCFGNGHLWVEGIERSYHYYDETGTVGKTANQFYGQYVCEYTS